jgi:lipid-A-disaccharide synthase
VIQPVARTATALTRQREQMMVTQNGVLVPADAMRKQMEARRRSEHIKARAEQALPPTVLAKGLTYDVMAHSDVLLTCSGTATLEAALFATPMVILYRGSKIMELEYRLRGMDKKIAYIGLPNILADRMIVPELIQREATPEAIATHALHLLNDPSRRQQARADLRSVKAFLGEPGASARTARLVVDLARQGTDIQ